MWGPLVTLGIRVGETFGSDEDLVMWIIFGREGGGEHPLCFNTLIKQKEAEK